MSRAYRIRVSESVTKTVHVRDGLVFRLELLDILGRERMTALVVEQLQERGFEADESDGTLVRRDGEIEVRVDPETGEVKVTLDASATITKRGSREARVYDPERGRESAERGLRGELDGKIDEETTGLQAAVTAELERHIPALRKELDRASTAVVAEALKERARQMGEVEDVSENAETGELTIRVRV